MTKLSALLPSVTTQKYRNCPYQRGFSLQLGASPQHHRGSVGYNEDYSHGQSESCLIDWVVASDSTSSKEIPLPFFDWQCISNRSRAQKDFWGLCDCMRGRATD